MRQPSAKIILLLIMLVPAISTAATQDTALLQAPLDRQDIGSLQRGAKMFVNYCQGCHNMRFMRYTRVAEDLAIPDEIARATLAFGGELFRPIMSRITPDQAVVWFDQAVPPDLSLVARVRGVDWLYSFLLGFYRDPASNSGWNNVVFDNVAMPHALYGLQGTYAMNEDGSLDLAVVGNMSQGEYDVAVADLVNFLAYAGDPARNDRLRIGYVVMIFVLILLCLMYLVYREYWRDIH